VEEVSAMPRSTRTTSTTIAALVLAMPLLAEAGYRVTDKSGNVTLVSKGRVKEVPSIKDAPQSMFDVVGSRAWMSNPQKKLYWEGTIDELCASIQSAMTGMKKTIEDAMAAQMAKMTPEQREKMEQVKKQMGLGVEEKQPPKAALSVERTDDVATIAGLKARRYRVLADGELHQESWLTTDPALTKEFVLDKAAAAMGRVASCSNRWNAGPTIVDETQVFQKLYLEGWPMKTVVHTRGQALTTAEVEKIEKRDVRDDEFAPPKDFRKTTLDEVMFAGLKRPPTKAPEGPR
ncbi:MAG: DUF4412 domain-containing protein, partial [Candidatus Binatia bacterium]